MVHDTMHWKLSLPQVLFLSLDACHNMHAPLPPSHLAKPLGVFLLNPTPKAHFCWLISFHNHLPLHLSMDCPLHHLTIHLHNLRLEWCALGCSQSLIKIIQAFTLTFENQYFYQPHLGARCLLLRV